MKADRISGILISAIVVLTPLVYWPHLKDYTLAPKLLAWQIPLVLLALRYGIRKVSLPGGPLTTAATGYLLISALSLLWATDTVAGVLELSKLATGLVFLFVLATRPEQEFSLYAEAAVAAASVSASLGILQHLDLAPWTIPSAGLPSGTLGFRNIAAMLAIQTLPFGLWLLVTSKRRDAIWAVCVAILLGFLIQTRTRGAWLGAAAALVFFVVIYYRFGLSLSGRGRRVLLAVTAGVVLGVLPARLEKVGPQSIDEKKTTISDAIASVVAPGGDRDRLTLWARTLDAIFAHPVAGVGLGNWAVEYPKYDRGSLVTYNGSPSRPHNDFLWIASEIGVIGLAAFIGMIGFAGRAVAQTLKRGRVPPVAFAAAASLIAILVHGCFSFPRERATPTMLFWFALGCIAATSATSLKRRKIEVRWMFGAATILLSITLTARVIAFESHMYRAILPERQGDWPAVAQHTAAALSEGNFHPEALHLHGYALNTSGRYPEAARHYERYAAGRPYDVQFLNGYAIALQNTGDLEAARKMYQRARSLVTSSVDLDYNLATLLIGMKRPAEAVRLLEQVRDREGLSGALLFHLGNARALSGQDEKAIEALEQAVDLDPAFAQARFVLGELYLRKDRASDARAAFREFLELHHTQDRYSRRARALLEELSN